MSSSWNMTLAENLENFRTALFNIHDKPKVLFIPNIAERRRTNQSTLENFAILRCSFSSFLAMASIHRCSIALFMLHTRSFANHCFHGANITHILRKFFKSLDTHYKERVLVFKNNSNPVQNSTYHGTSIVYCRNVFQPSDLRISPLWLVYTFCFFFAYFQKCERWKKKYNHGRITTCIFAFAYFLFLFQPSSRWTLRTRSYDGKAWTRAYPWQGYVSRTDHVNWRTEVPCKWIMTYAHVHKSRFEKTQFVCKIVGRLFRKMLQWLQ